MNKKLLALIFDAINEKTWTGTAFGGAFILGSEKKDFLRKVSDFFKPPLNVETQNNNNKIIKHEELFPSVMASHQPKMNAFKCNYFTLRHPTDSSVEQASLPTIGLHFGGGSDCAAIETNKILREQLAMVTTKGLDLLLSN